MFCSYVTRKLRGYSVLFIFFSEALLRHRVFKLIFCLCAGVSQEKFPLQNIERKRLWGGDCSCKNAGWPIWVFVDARTAGLQEKYFYSVRMYWSFLWHKKISLFSGRREVKGSKMAWDPKLQLLYLRICPLSEVSMDVRWDLWEWERGQNALLRGMRYINEMNRSRNIREKCRKLCNVFSQNRIGSTVKFWERCLNCHSKTLWNVINLQWGRS